MTDSYNCGGNEARRRDQVSQIATSRLPKQGRKRRPVKTDAGKEKQRTSKPTGETLMVGSGFNMGHSFLRHP